MKTIGQLINEFETSCAPENIRVKYKSSEFEVYPWLKPAIFSALQQGNATDTGNKSKRYQLLKLFSGFKYLFKNPETIVLTNSMERRILNGDVYDKLFNSIATNDQLQNCVSIEAKFPSNAYPKSSYIDKRCASRSIFYLCEMLRSKLIGRIEIESNKELTEFLERYGVTIDIDAIVKKNIAQYLVFKRFFERRKNIKRLFLSAAYTNFGVVNACKECGISVVEVQHGVINAEHYGYNYCYMPKKDQFPQYLLTIGEADVEFIESTKISKYVTPIAIGSFILDYYQSNSPKLNEQNSVAVSLQDCSTGEEAYKVFIELASLLPDIQFRFKRRRLSLEHYKKLTTLPANVFFEEEKDVYQLILACNLHLTAYSSCALEAPALGRRNILFNLNDKARQYYAIKLPDGISTRYADNLKDLSVMIPEMIQAQTNESDIMAANAANVKTSYEQNLSDFVNTLNE